jgi:hypothetical protein
MALTQTELIQGPVTPGGVALSLSSTDLAAGSVGTTQLAASAVTKAKMQLFISTVQTGTGSAQNIAHGLGVVPTNVFVSFTGSTSSQAVTEGTHTTTNVVVTVTSGATFKVFAIV